MIFEHSYINGDFIEIEAEWIKNEKQLNIPPGTSIEDILTEVKKLEISKDLYTLQGKTVRLLLKMRGTKLYAMQFLNK